MSGVFQFENDYKEDFAMIFSFFAVFLMIALNLAIPICIAVYVYQDPNGGAWSPFYGRWWRPLCHGLSG